MFPCKEIVDARPKSRAGRGSRRQRNWCETSPMKKLVAVLVIALVVAVAVWVVLRIQLAKRVAVVPELLPQETLLLVEVPDFQRTRTHWHAERSIPDLARTVGAGVVAKTVGIVCRRDRGGRQTLEDFLQLGPTCGFLALTSVENNEPKVIGGFHFDQSRKKRENSSSNAEADLWRRRRMRNARRSFTSSTRSRR